MRPRSLVDAARWGAQIAIAWLVTGCLDDRAYPCATDPECQVDGVLGVCLGTGFCAYPDGRCPSQLRYGPAAAGDLALECVPGGGNDGTDTMAFVDPQSSSSPAEVESSVADTQSSDSQGCDGCITPPSECFDALGSCEDDECVYPPLDAGTPCPPLDPCVVDAACDGAGTCLPVRGTTCDNPPGPCDSPRGVCERDGSCTYDPMLRGSPCDDGDPCTQNEACDGAGACVGGQPCESDNPCETASCASGRCEITAAEDGDSCGPNAADRCCAGACVDISTDGSNCGGCGVTCDADDACESVAATSTCELAPAATTGRCTCDAANIDCPIGQICRTVTPFNNRCTPDGPDDCVNEWVDINLCPNYCEYP